MLLMMLIMSLPLLGIGLFFVLPLVAAVPAYLALVGFFGIYQWLMMGAMRLPVRTGRENIIKSTGKVLNWEGGSGQVICEGEIWHAETEGKQSFARGDRVAIQRMNGLTLTVGPAGGCLAEC